MLEIKRISDAIESVRGRLEESCSCPAPIVEYPSMFPLSGSSLCDQGKKDSSPIMVAKSPPFYCDRGRYHNRVKITIRVSPDKRKNPLRGLFDRKLSIF